MVFLMNGKGSLIQFVAGLFVLLSVVLGITISNNWFYFTGLVGTMLMVSSLTGFCPMELLLKAFGMKEKRCSQS